MYNFKINSITTNDETIINPKKINIIIGPNNSGKSRFLKDIKNSLGCNNSEKNENIIIKDISYELPKDKEEFITRYSLRNRIFKFDTHQFLISNYSGIGNYSFSVDSQFNNYLNSGNISIGSEWEKDLERYIYVFRSENQEIPSVLVEYDLPADSKIISQEFVEYVEDGETKRKMLGMGESDYTVSKAERVVSFIDTYGKLFFNYLGTEEKLLMSKMQSRYGLEEHETNFLSGIQCNSDLLKELSDYTKSMFNKDIYLDRYTCGNKILFRVGDDFSFIRESSRDDSAAEIKLKDYGLLDEEGDGIKSFVTAFLSLKTNDKNILLLDEPESFLHPPLAKQLGEIIATTAAEDKQIFISTHSVNLLKGILSIEKDVNIIRITRNGDVNRINVLEGEHVSDILSNSLLGSATILNGLFCEKVFICEAEADEEIFQIVHDKVNLVDSALFIHAKNKQTMKDIAQMYNDLKVPNYRIYDFDLLMDSDFNNALNGFIEKEKKDEFISLVTNARKFLVNDNEDYLIEPEIVENYADCSGKLNEIFTSSDEIYKIPKDLKTKLVKNFKKILSSIKTENDRYYNGGLDFIEDDAMKEDLTRMFEYLKENGIIVLKTGCLESVFKDIGLEYSSNKKSWFPAALALLNDINSTQLQSSNLYDWLFK